MTDWLTSFPGFFVGYSIAVFLAVAFILGFAWAGNKLLDFKELRSQERFDRRRRESHERRALAAPPRPSSEEQRVIDKGHPLYAKGSVYR